MHKGLKPADKLGVEDPKTKMTKVVEETDSYSDDLDSKILSPDQIKKKLEADMKKGGMANFDNALKTSE